MSKSSLIRLSALVIVFMAHNCASIPMSLMGFFAPDAQGWVIDQFLASMENFHFPKAIIHNNFRRWPHNVLRLRQIATDFGWQDVPLGRNIEIDGRRTLFNDKLDRSYRVRLEVFGSGDGVGDWVEFEALSDGDRRSNKYLVNNKGVYQIGENGMPRLIAEWTDGVRNNRPSWSPSQPKPDFIPPSVFPTAAPKGQGFGDRASNANIIWQAGDWAFNCDFRNDDMGSVVVSGDKCGQACVSTARCTHFTWSNGVCYLKSRNGITKLDAFHNAKYDNAITCGIVNGGIIFG